MAISPTLKKTALVQYSSSASRMGFVNFGSGPSSKVSTTSLGPKKRGSFSYLVYSPNSAPVLVSISTMRDTPSAASGFLQAASSAAAGAAHAATSRSASG